MQDQMWLTLRNYYMISENPYLAFWFNDHVIHEAEAELDVKDGCMNAMFTNWDHYQSTKGWIA